jgi:hypothetical protein
MDMSWVAMREDDLVAEKLEKMLLESLRSFGEAGDSGWLWNGAFGDGRSDPLKWLGDVGLVGLVGLMGALALSLDRPRMAASDKDPDLGILRSCFRGGLRGWRSVSTDGRQSCHRLQSYLCVSVGLRAAQSVLEQAVRRAWERC